MTFGPITSCFSVERDFKYYAVPNNCVYTIIYFRFFSNILIKQEVFFYVIPKKSYVIIYTFIPTPRLFGTAEYLNYILHAFSN